MPNDPITQPGADPANPGAPGLPPANPNPAAPANPNPTPDPAPEPKNWYADTWRKEMSGGDEKIAKRLERFTDPNGVMKSWLAAEQKISSGEYKRSAKPENATPEQIAQWRAESGIPEAPTGYDIKIDEKLVTEGDKEYLDQFYKFAHESDMPKAYVEKMVNYLFTGRKAQMDQIATQDKADRAETEEKLRADFGNDYMPNMNLMSGLLDGQPEEVKANFMNARLADGTLLTNDPSIVKMLVGFAREINPAAAYVPNAGNANTMQSVEDEIATIEKYMRTNRDEYFKDQKKQARYDVLLAAREKLKTKAA